MKWLYGRAIAEQKSKDSITLQPNGIIFVAGQNLKVVKTRVVNFKK